MSSPEDRAVLLLQQTSELMLDGWDIPLSHPIRGNFTTYSGERCIYHVKGGQFYDKTKPERCYATEDEARQDGCRRSKR